MRKEETVAVSAMRAGFTLIEILVADKYEKKGKRFVVISAGPDGEFGGDDDIRSDVTKRSTGND